MPYENWLLPEDHHRQEQHYSPEQLQAAREQGHVLRGRVLRCDGQRQLTVRLGDRLGLIPAGEGVAPFLSGAERDIALLSCAGRQVCCLITGQREAANGEPLLLLSRRQAQEKAMARLEAQLQPGDVLRAQVTHLAPFGAFVDVGCGLISLIPLSAISVARIRHPGERFFRGQHIFARLLRLDPEAHRLYLSHRELLGSWQENAAEFQPGETVPGIVRGNTPHGVFVELTPNLVGLADPQDAAPPEGSAVSVRIRSIQPRTQKIRLQLVQELGPASFPTPLRYRVSGGRLLHWSYREAPAN